jgi:hypothetical protein
MYKIFFAILSGAAIYSACGVPSYGADYVMAPQPSFVAPPLERRPSVWFRAGGDCGRQLCAFNTSVFSLYGSYGPDGGSSYWGAYTSAGWGD